MKLTWTLIYQKLSMMDHYSIPITLNSFDLSGSTASYYRGSGLAIHLSMEQILQNSTANASSLATSDEVNSQPIDLHMELVPARVDY